MFNDKRFICLDTETTGLSVANGDRIIEIGMVEIVNMEIARKYQSYFKSEQKLSDIVKNITKITDETLVGQPDFAEKAKEIMDFLQKDANNNDNQAILVIHNAKFDLSFLNFQLNESIEINLANFQILDTMDIIRHHSPGSKLTLDSLCEKYEISLQERESIGHGALLDSELLARVFLALISDGAEIFKQDEQEEIRITKRENALPARKFELNENEIAIHEAMLQKLNLENW